MTSTVRASESEAILEIPPDESVPKGLVPRRGIWIAVCLFICSLAALAAWDLGVSPSRSSSGAESGMQGGRSQQGAAALERLGTTPSPLELQQVIEAQAGRAATPASPEASRPVPATLPAGPLPPGLPGEPALPLEPRAGQRSNGPTSTASVERVAEASVSGIFSLSEGGVTAENPLSQSSQVLQGRRASLLAAPTVAEPISASNEASRRSGDLSADALRMMTVAGQNSQQPTRASRDEAWLKDYAQGRPADAAFAEEPASAWLVFQGTRIPVVTRETLNSDLPGQVTALSTAPVFDSIRQCAVLIPQGARFIGQYSSDIRAGQSRMLLAFRRMILPDGRSVQLAGSPAVDQAGQSGASGDIDNHFLQMFGYGFAIAWIADRLGGGGSAVTVTQPNGQSTSTTVAGQVLADTSTRILNRNAVIPPTLTIDAGTRMFVTVTRDLALNPVSKGACL